MLWADTQNLPYLILQNKTTTLWMTQNQARMKQRESNKKFQKEHIHIWLHSGWEYKKHFRS
jgi:hypothetical protein